MRTFVSFHPQQKLQRRCTWSRCSPRRFRNSREPCRERRKDNRRPARDTLRWCQHWRWRCECLWRRPREPSRSGRVGETEWNVILWNRKDFFLSDVRSVWWLATPSRRKIRRGRLFRDERRAASNRIPFLRLPSRLQIVLINRFRHFLDQQDHKLASSSPWL